METLFANAYTRPEQKQSKEKSQNQSQKTSFFSMAFWKVYKQKEWRLRNDMEIKLWKLSGYKKEKFYSFEDFTELLALFC